ncbi:SDR family NAD(P)-dependent oxidoreductase [Psittacicella hinzii]|uniref:Short-chain dehydrogenase n=1 Tax=Psittacicella hinzii TaxID=2028575 RepID=A0A3A1YEY5_9GAMM|nr:SDR family NAD(P)-dependent oxidoreductase [Psittacicella hinzii]RIY34607.1 hypothetical protein CKF58_08035 [Psittacicella hinzii]
MAKILITGSSSGMGLASAQLFASKGWEVIAVIRNPEQARHLEALGIKVKYCEQTQYAKIEQLFQDPDLQNFDAAFLNAGYGHMATVEDTTPQALEAQLACNTVGTWAYFNACIKVFRQQGHGRILVNSSVISFSPIPYRAAYGASKAALDQMVETFRIENRDPNIQASLLHPGPVATNFRQRALHEYQTQTKNQDTVYAQDYAQQEQRLQNKNRKRFTAQPEQAAALAYKCLTSKKQKIHYFLCLPTYVVWYAKKILPASWFEFFIRHAHKLEK